jgi:hypothetical protein
MSTRELGVIMAANALQDPASNEGGETGARQRPYRLEVARAESTRVWSVTIRGSRQNPPKRSFHFSERATFRFGVSRATLKPGLAAASDVRGPAARLAWRTAEMDPVSFNVGKKMGLIQENQSSLHVRGTAVRCTASSC